MGFKELTFLVYYSVKSLIVDLFEFLNSLKKAKTWSFILYATFFLGVYYKNYTVIKIALPLILLLYIIRQNKEPDYNRVVREKAFMSGEDERIMVYYKKYCKQCFFANTTPKSFEEYKVVETKKLKV